MGMSKVPAICKLVFLGALIACNLPMSVVAAERVETSIQIRLKILEPKTVKLDETISASAAIFERALMFFARREWLSRW